MPTEKQKFYRLLSEVCDDLPTSAINAVVASGYPANAISLMQVRQGRTINLPHLIKLVQVGLPDFSISQELMPATPAAKNAPLFQAQAQE